MKAKTLVLSACVLIPPVYNTACNSPPRAGTTIDTLVVNSAPDATTPRWRLSEIPTLSIGLEGDSLYELNFITGVRSLSDGRIVIANDGKELRYYDRRGQHLKTVGRRGQGPEEIHEFLDGIAILPGDSVAARDLNHSFFRVLIFTHSGEYSRSLDLDIASAVPTLDGAWIGIAQPRHGSGKCPEGSSIQRSMARIIRVEKLHGQQDLASILAGYSFYVAGCNSYSLPYSARGHFAVGERHLFTTADSGHSIHVRSLTTGAIQRTIQTNERPRELTRQMIEYVERPRRGLVRQESGRAQEELARLLPPPPRTLPAIGSITIDSRGNLWVRRYYVPADSKHEWWIYDTKGSLVASLMTDAKLRVTEIGADYILGVFRDDQDIETVRKYALLRH